MYTVIWGPLAWAVENAATPAAPSAKAAPPIRSSFVRIDPAILAEVGIGDRVEFALFDDVHVAGTVSGRIERRVDRFTLFGQLDHAGDFLLAVNREAVAGYINARPHGAFRIRLR